MSILLKIIKGVAILVNATIDFTFDENLELDFIQDSYFECTLLLRGDDKVVEIRLDKEQLDDLKKFMLVKQIVF
ncbi:hypothetical protein EDM57_04480 [Brevibacillus gelatini]|uniref:Uncharacterized protein n=1 Tax=Brevibacillus gelatini TaxID=1655277 RepID=A0A3M8B7W0_9BACL|nr:hypothetical protein EDM57_04480 [Brevibacillus gelatini]